MNKELWYFFARNKENPVYYNSALNLSHERALELLHASDNDFAVIIRAGEDDLSTAQAIYWCLYQKWFDITECENAKKIHDPK